MITRKINKWVMASLHIYGYQEIVTFWVDEQDIAFHA